MRSHFDEIEANDVRSHFLKRPYRFQRLPGSRAEGFGGADPGSISMIDIVDVECDVDFRPPKTADSRSELLADRRAHLLQHIRRDHLDALGFDVFHLAVMEVLA